MNPHFTDTRCLIKEDDNQGKFIKIEDIWQPSRMFVSEIKFKTKGEKNLTKGETKPGQPITVRKNLIWSHSGLPSLMQRTVSDMLRLLGSKHYGYCQIQCLFLNKNCSVGL